MRARKTSLTGKLHSICLGILCLVAFCAQAKETFRIGDPAPEFRAGRWLNGQPVERFEPGQIYVLEFWATWCGPCIAAMPHLSELARKHARKVTMIGVNIQERGDDPAKIDRQVDRFMDNGGKAMQYPVCRDTPDGYLTKEWYERSGLAGIPATIVVDGKGKIAWLGNPAVGLDKALDQLVAGSFDYQASSTEAAAKARRAQEISEVMTPVSLAVQAKEWSKAMTLINAAVAKDAKYAGVLTSFRYLALLHVNEAEAYAQTLAAAEGSENRRYLASIIAKEDGLSKRMYDLAAGAVDGQSDPSSLQAMAMLSYRRGEPAKAVELQKRLIEVATEMKTAPVYMDALEEDLKKFEAAVGQPGEQASPPTQEQRMQQRAEAARKAAGELRKNATLRIGDPAPPLKVRWIKGEKPVNFTDGKVHVLEFWATWCGPCKRNMPHMSHLAQKYRGKVEVISVSIWETKDPAKPYEPEVISFVQHAGKMMDHAVAMDTPDDFMGTNWVKASGQAGIPAAVLIDRQGKVAWSGTAFAGIDEAIELALQDKLDPAAAARTVENYRAGMKRRDELRAAAEAALKAGKPDEAVKFANQASEAVPAFANGQWPILYRAYKAKGDRQAARFVSQVAREHATAPIDLQELAREIGDDDPVAVLKLLKAGMKYSRPTEPAMAIALAKAYARTGDYRNAVVAQGNALQGLPKSSSDARIQQMIDSHNKVLEEYRQKAGSPAAST